MRKLTTEEFIQQSNVAHNGFYDYSNSVYINSRTKINIICPVHGIFEQKADSHLRGIGCQKCHVANRIKTNEYFIHNASNVHNKKYDYSKVKYTQAKNHVTIICPIHGEFEQQARNHLSGQGCPDCASSGFNPNKSAYLYYLKITTDDNKILYKIGITNRTVEARFSLTDLSKIEIVKQKLYANGQEALDWETKLKYKYKQYQYKGPAVLKDGNTELFTEDIITMWHKEHS